MKAISIKRRSYDLEPLPTDSFADLYIATSKDSKAPRYIVKFLKKKLQSNTQALRRFKEEHIILKSLQSHRDHFPIDVCKGLHNRQPYIAYRHIDGETLLTALKSWHQDTFTLAYCCGLIQRLLLAIRVLHTQASPIIHSDISPENVILVNKHVFLIDFGCAQQLKPDAMAAHWKAKPGYLSPEQARGEMWDHRSDLYQAGILFYEILTGTKWNTGPTTKERVAWASSPPPINVAPIPLKLRPLLRGMLEIDTNERIQSAELCLLRLQYARRAMKVGRHP